MARHTKTAQLQIRVTPAQKASIARSARRAGVDMSTYVLDRVLSAPAGRFQACIRSCAHPASARMGLAELNTLLTGLTGVELREAVADPPVVALPAETANYVAAMIEVACVRSGDLPPGWVSEVPPLEQPVFGSDLLGLRLYLLTHSPPAFRRRNIFIDSTIGAQV